MYVCPAINQCSFVLVGLRYSITTASAIYSLPHGLRTLTAVPRSTQPSTLHGMVTWVSAFGLSNNNRPKWRRWKWMVAVYWRSVKQCTRKVLQKNPIELSMTNKKTRCLVITHQLWAPRQNSGRGRRRKVQFSEIQKVSDLDLDLRSGQGHISMPNTYRTTSVADYVTA